MKINCLIVYTYLLFSTFLLALDMSDKVELKNDTAENESDQSKKSIEILSERTENMKPEEIKSDVCDEIKAEEVTNKKTAEEIPQSPPKDTLIPSSEEINAENIGNNKTEQRIDEDTSGNKKENLKIVLSPPTSSKSSSKNKKYKFSKEKEKSLKNTQKILVEVHDHGKGEKESTNLHKKGMKIKGKNS